MWAAVTGAIKLAFNFRNVCSFQVLCETTSESQSPLALQKLFRNGQETEPPIFGRVSSKEDWGSEKSNVAILTLSMLYLFREACSLHGWQDSSIHKHLKPANGQRHTISFHISFSFHVLCESLILSSILTEEISPVSGAVCVPTTQSNTWCLWKPVLLKLEQTQQFVG